MRTIQQALAAVGEQNISFHMEKKNHSKKGDILHIKIGIAEITFEYLHFRIVEKHCVTLLFYGRVLQSGGMCSRY